MAEPDSDMLLMAGGAEFGLPFPSGARYRITQAPFGGFSHVEGLRSKPHVLASAEETVAPPAVTLSSMGDHVLSFACVGVPSASDIGRMIVTITRCFDCHFECETLQASALPTEDDDHLF